MHFDAEFYVAVGFTIFVLVLLWVGAHSKFTALIDSRIDRIKGELAEAERLRSEAQSLLASFEKKRTQPASPQASTTNPLSRNFFSMPGRIFSRT